MPGPNDYHVKLVETTNDDGKTVKIPTIEPGLGADEPSEVMRAGARMAAAKALEAQRKVLEQTGAALTEKERALMLQEEQQLQAQANLEARERALADREAAFHRAIAAAEDAGQ